MRFAHVAALTAACSLAALHTPAAAQPSRTVGSAQAVRNPNAALGMRPITTVPSPGCRARAGQIIAPINISTTHVRWTHDGAETWPAPPPNLPFSHTYGWTQALSPQAQWIWTIPPGGNPNLPFGFYNYEITFVIPSCPATPYVEVTVDGQFAADNFASAWLDGVMIAFSNGAPHYGHATSGITQFRATVPQGAPGVHTLQLRVRNDAYDLSGLIVLGTLSYS